MCSPDMTCRAAEVQDNEQFININIKTRSRGDALTSHKSQF